MKNKPVCESIRAWLTANLGDGCLGILSGTDNRALKAAVHILELYGVAPTRGVASAFGAVVMEMQPKCWHLAYHAIAAATDWSYREKIWTEAGLPAIEIGKCRCE